MNQYVELQEEEGTWSSGGTTPVFQETPPSPDAFDSEAHLKQLLFR